MRNFMWREIKTKTFKADFQSAVAVNMHMATKHWEQENGMGVIIKL